VDFDDLKRDYLEAADRLGELAASRPAPAAFAYDDEAFMGELRDLVARGLPVSGKAVRKNKAYAASIDYVSRCIKHLYGTAYSFARLDEQLDFIYRRIPRVYYYVLQVFWSSADCANGYAYTKAIAVRHLGCISGVLREMGFSSLEAFLSDVIEIAGRLAEAGIADRGGA
jgi:hypothetical protein